MVLKNVSQRVFFMNFKEFVEKGKLHDEHTFIHYDFILVLQANRLPTWFCFFSSSNWLFFSLAKKDNSSYVSLDIL